MDASCWALESCLSLFTNPPLMFPESNLGGSGCHPWKPMILPNWHFNGENHCKLLDVRGPSVTKCCIYPLQVRHRGPVWGKLFDQTVLSDRSPGDCPTDLLGSSWGTILSHTLINPCPLSYTLHNHIIICIYYTYIYNYMCICGYNIYIYIYIYIYIL